MLLCTDRSCRTHGRAESVRLVRLHNVSYATFDREAETKAFRPLAVRPQAPPASHPSPVHPFPSPDPAAPPGCPRDDRRGGPSCPRGRGGRRTAHAGTALGHEAGKPRDARPDARGGAARDARPDGQRIGARDLGATEPRCFADRSPGNGREPRLGIPGQWHGVSPPREPCGATGRELRHRPLRIRPRRLRDERGEPLPRALALQRHRDADPGTPLR